MFGNGDAYKVHAVFENAGQLVKGNEVRVGGQTIGTITESSSTTLRRPS